MLWQVESLKTLNSIGPQHKVWWLIVRLLSIRSCFFFSFFFPGILPLFWQGRKWGCNCCPCFGCQEKRRVTIPEVKMFSNRWAADKLCWSSRKYWCVPVVKEPKPGRVTHQFIWRLEIQRHTTTHRTENRNPIKMLQPGNEYNLKSVHSR